MLATPLSPPPGLLDPRWVENQKKTIEDKRSKKEVFEEGVQIGSNLKHLAERRTDIFGREETVIGQKIGEEYSAKPSVQWDGHSGRWVWLGDLCYYNNCCIMKHTVGCTHIQ